jgi:two-component system sensor histidine kinase PilS (NtrC family)
MIQTGIRKWSLRFGVGSPPSTGMREGLQWLALARLAVLYVMLAAVVVLQLFPRASLTDGRVSSGYALLTIGFAFNFLYAIFLEKLPARWWLAASHIVFDCAITSAWIVLSPGKDNLFALVFLIQILLVSLTLYQKGAWFAAVASSAAFGYIVHLHSEAYPTPLATWAIFSGIFITVGLVGGYLSEELLRTSESLKEKQKKIERLTALHEEIISNMPTGLLAVDHEMRVNFVNPAGEHILNRRREELVGHPLNEVEAGLLPFFSQLETENIPEPAEENDAFGVLMEKTAVGSDHHRSYFVESKSDKGRARLQQRVELGTGLNRRILRGDVAALGAEAGVGVLLRAGSGGGRVLLFQDVTKLVHLEERLKQNEKLAAVGQLAAGIAHEIRNPLASMSGSIEMLRESLPDSGPFSENRKLMDIAIREIDRLNRLITEFLDFVKPDTFKKTKVDLPWLMGEVVLTMRRQKEGVKKIEIREAYEVGCTAHGNEAKLRQVILNLVVNAFQAMTKDGVVEVGCGKSGSDRVKFWVVDEGQGMNDEVLAHLYEPFFTTKEKGTGLGLATAYKIIEAHQGEIRVSSRAGVGTRFEVFLQAG